MLQRCSQLQNKRLWTLSSDAWDSPWIAMAMNWSQKSKIIFLIHMAAMCSAIFPTCGGCSCACPETKEHLLHLPSFFFLSTSSQPFMMLSSNATAVRTHVISCPIVTAVFGISSQSNPLWLLFIITYVRFLFNNRICHCTVLRRRVCH